MKKAKKMDEGGLAGSLTFDVGECSSVHVNTPSPAMSPMFLYENTNE
jgi:hypothetical protein